MGESVASVNSESSGGSLINLNVFNLKVAVFDVHYGFSWMFVVCNIRMSVVAPTT